MFGTAARFSRIAGTAALVAGLSLACTGRLLEPDGAPGIERGRPGDPGSGGNAGNAGSGGTPGTEIKNCAVSTTGHVGLQRLTSSQIVNTLSDLLGVSVTPSSPARCSTWSCSAYSARSRRASRTS